MLLPLPLWPLSLPSLPLPPSALSPFLARGTATMPLPPVERAKPAEEPPPAPAPKEPTEWVHTWLKGHGLERLAPKLIDARFVDEDDLKMEPKLTLEELEKLGVEKAAERRKLLGLIRGL